MVQYLSLMKGGIDRCPDEAAGLPAELKMEKSPSLVEGARLEIA